MLDVEFFAILFWLENTVFAGIGVMYLVSRLWQNRKMRRQLEEERARMEEERRKELQSVREEMTSMKEMMADLLLELDRRTRAIDDASTRDRDVSLSR